MDLSHLANPRHAHEKIPHFHESISSNRGVTQKQTEHVNYKHTHHDDEEEKRWGGGGGARGR